MLRQVVQMLGEGKHAQALGLCRQILADEPENPEALHLGGLAAFSMGDGDQAVSLLERSVASRADYFAAQNDLGSVLKFLGRLDEAEAAYRRAIAINADAIDPHYNLGLVLEERGGHAEAEAAFRRATALDPDFALAHMALGDALSAQALLDDATAAYGEAIRLRPDLIGAHVNLASVLHNLGRFDDAIDRLNEALRVVPGHAVAQYNMAVSLQQSGRLDEAVAAYRAALAANPENVEALDNLGQAFLQLGDLDQALATYQRAVALAPDFARVHAGLADAYLARGDPPAAVAACDAFLEAHPGDTRVLAFKATALNDLGEGDKVATLLDFERFIRPVRLEAPPGFATIEAFNRALAEHILDHPTLMYAPTGQATRKGRHSAELLVGPKGPVGHLETAIREAVDAYIRAQGTDPSHPFLADPPKSWTLTTWAVVMDSGGHQVAHIHPMAWLSGVYYVRMPEVVRSGSKGEAGWIEFGRPPEAFHFKKEPPVKAYQPEEGLMFLFPSYFYHETIPFRSEEKRICIAFDVIAGA